MDDKRSVLAQDSGASAESVYVAAWWGRCNIPNQEIDINLAAHIPHAVRWKLASILPDSLCLNQISRDDVWPAYFDFYPPTEINIDFIFFSEGRDEIVLDNMLNDAICSDFALKAKIGEAELLIFTSLQLPEKLHRSKGKCYFWGIIMARNPFFSQKKLKNDARIEKNKLKPTLSSRLDDQRSHKGKMDPIDISNNQNIDQEKAGRMHVSDEQNLCTQAAKANKRKWGQLDDAWKYAYQLDQFKNKTMCRLCGFVSTSGGISRLKAHLAGGRHQLPGCPNVFPEIKQAMVIWFQKWVKKASAFWVKEPQSTKNASAYWVKEPQDSDYQSSDQGKVLSLNTYDEQNPNQGKGGPLDCSDAPNPLGTANTHKKGRQPDNAWEHAITLDKMRQRTKCKYCDFVSASGGIARLQVHLGGGDPNMPLEGCSNVPPEVKVLMSEVLSQKKVVANETIQVTDAAHGAQVHYATRTQLDDAWKYAKQLDDSRNKIECRYCGFVSKFGGISRMKVHLAGGSPESHVPGCPNVSPEVKQVMVVWFSEFLKNSKAYWLKETPEEPDNTFKRKRKQNNTWGHAIRLDKEYVTKGEYCGFVSNGGISHMKVQLAGSDLSVQSKYRPNVPPEVKALVSEVIISEPVTKIEGGQETAEEKNQAEDCTEPAREGNGREETAEEQIQAEGINEIARNIKGRDETAEEKAKGENISELASKRKGREETNEDSEHADDISKLARKINGGEETAEENIQEIEESNEAQGTLKRPHFLQFVEKVTNITSKETIGRILEKKNAKLEKVQIELLILESHLASLP